MAVMTGKVRIAIEDVVELEDRRQAINSVPLEDIEWTRDGKAIEIPTTRISDFATTGLSNIDFVVSGTFGILK